MGLSTTAINAMKPQEKVYRIADGEGLSIEIRPSGAKYWRYRYRFHDKPNMITLGEYPSLTIRDARRLRDEAKDKLAQGIDPAQTKKLAKAEIVAAIEEQKQEAQKLSYTFQNAFDDWMLFKKPSWSNGYADDVAARARMYLIPRLGKMALVEVKPIDVLDTLKRCEQAGKLDTLKKVRSILSQVLRYAVAMQKIDTDPSRDIPVDVFQKQPKRNQAHQTLPAEIRRVYQAIQQPYKGTFEIANAMKLLPLTVLRASELTGLLWQEVDFENRLLRISAERMKMKKAHIVPLSDQALAILKDQLAHNRSETYVFPSPLSERQPIRIEALLKAMRTQGIDKDTFSNHGWRHAFSTTMNELGFEPLAVEAQLAHVLQGVQGVYSKAQYLEQRASMMQKWNDWLENKI